MPASAPGRLAFHYVFASIRAHLQVSVTFRFVSLSTVRQNIPTLVFGNPFVRSPTPGATQIMNGKRCDPCPSNASTRKKDQPLLLLEHAPVLLHRKSDVSAKDAILVQSLDAITHRVLRCRALSHWIGLQFSARAWKTT